MLAPALAWRPPRDACERAYAKLLLVDATRGALPRAGENAVVAALEHVFAHLRFREPAADPKTRKVLRANQIFNPTSMCAHANGLTRALPPCFENLTRAIDPSKNQPNRLRCDRAREFSSLAPTSRLTG